jgi:anaerobic selenocysteine-containing dehydrogenase
LAPPRITPKTGTAPAAAGSIYDHLASPKAAEPQEAKFEGDGKYVLIPYLSSVFGDGYAANRPWLQELPDPMAMVTWADFIEISMQTAQDLGVLRGDIIKLSSPAGELQGPAYPTLGLHPEAIAIPLGQGHFWYGRYAGRGMQVLQVVAPTYHEGTGELALASTRVSASKTEQNVNLISLDRRLGGQAREPWPEYRFKSDHEDKFHYGMPENSPPQGSQ